VLSYLRPSKQQQRQQQGNPRTPNIWATPAVQLQAVHSKMQYMMHYRAQYML
jgi:hypothetical protein